MIRFMKSRSLGWLKFALRWGIAVAGITWVIWNLTWSDRALVILDEQTQRPVQAVVLAVGDNAIRVRHPDTSAEVEVPMQRVLSEADPTTATLNNGRDINVLGLRLSSDLTSVEQILVADWSDSAARWIDPTETKGPYQPNVPHPPIQVGVKSMVQSADPSYLWTAVLIFPITILLTSYRWFLIMRTLEIRIPMPRAFVLNMVGLFYNSFMPGSTGGDVLKAYYASKHTKDHRTRAVMSVVVDRILGLVALIIIGSAMAIVQWHIPACRSVAIGGGILIFCAVVSGLILATPSWRRATGAGWVLRRLPLQKQVNKSLESLEILRGKIAIPLLALVMTFPVHLTVILVGTFAGLAFGLPVNPLFYFAAVPVIILVGAIPISPQGAGVMEFFAVQLLSTQGATVAEALALTMSIRLVHMLWNLTGGIFVFRGGYHSLSEEEEHELVDDDPTNGNGTDTEASESSKTEANNKTQAGEAPAA